MATEEPRLSDRLLAKMEEIDLLQKSVGELEKELKERRELKKKQRSKEQISFFMNNLIIPYLEGIANGFNEPLLAGVQRLIREAKNPFRPKEDWDRTRETSLSIDRFLKSSDPRILLIKNLAKPFVRAKFETINEEASWIREQILKEDYPALYAAIMEREGGQEWLDQLIEDLFRSIKRYLRS